MNTVSGRYDLWDCSCARERGKEGERGNLVRKTVLFILVIIQTCIGQIDLIVQGLNVQTSMLDCKLRF